MKHPPCSMHACMHAILHACESRRRRACRMHGPQLALPITKCIFPVNAQHLRYVMRKLELPLSVTGSGASCCTTASAAMTVVAIQGTTSRRILRGHDPKIRPEYSTIVLCTGTLLIGVWMPVHTRDVQSITLSCT